METIGTPTEYHGEAPGKTIGALQETNRKTNGILSTIEQITQYIRQFLGSTGEVPGGLRRALGGPRRRQGGPGRPREASWRPPGAS